MGHSRMHSYHAGTASRSTSSMAQYGSARGQIAEAETNGTVPCFLPSPSPSQGLSLSVRKHSKGHQAHSKHPKNQRSSSRIGSRSTRPNVRTASARSPPPTCSRDISISTAFSRMKLDDREPRKKLFERKSEEGWPKTPTQIPRLAPATTVAFQHMQHRGRGNLFDTCTLSLPPSPNLSPCKSPSRPSSRSASPAKPQFLSKSSTLIAPLEVEANSDSWSAWDVSARIESVESLYADLKNQMQGSAFDRNNFKETIDLMKTRSNDLG